MGKFIKIGNTMINPNKIVAYQTRTIESHWELIVYCRGGHKFSMLSRKIDAINNKVKEIDSEQEN